MGNRAFDYAEKSLITGELTTIGAGGRYTAVEGEWYAGGGSGLVKDAKGTDGNTEDNTKDTSLGSFRHTGQRHRIAWGDESDIM